MRKQRVLSKLRLHRELQNEKQKNEYPQNSILYIQIYYYIDSKSESQFKSTSTFRDFNISKFFLEQTGFHLFLLVNITVDKKNCF